MVELQVFIGSLPFLAALPRGDGHPIVVLPGFTANDSSTETLRWFLADRGYAPAGWELGHNHGPTDAILDGMDALMNAHVARGRRVTLIGWSLGGIYARELARTYPDAVRAVITLASPFRLRDPAASNVSAMYESLTHLHSERARVPHPPEEDRPALPVPVTNVFTRTDGVVHWQSCIDEYGDCCENVEVVGSHSGLGHNPLALAVIADRLAQPDGDWRPYRAPVCLSGGVRVGPVPSRPAVAA